MFVGDDTTADERQAIRRTRHEGSHDLGDVTLRRRPVEPKFITTCRVTGSARRFNRSMEPETALQVGRLPADEARGRVGAPRITMTVAEAAQLLGLSESATYEAVGRGEIPAVKIGRRVLVKRDALFAMLSSTQPRVDPL
jgi:excisionase family DNA binding protein